MKNSVNLLHLDGIEIPNVLLKNLLFFPSNQMIKSKKCGVQIYETKANQKFHRHYFRKKH